MIEAEILSYEGNRDAIRFGLVKVGRRLRSYQIDLLSGAVRLFTRDDGRGRKVEPDEDPDHVAATSKALATLRADQHLSGRGA